MCQIVKGHLEAFISVKDVALALRSLKANTVQIEDNDLLIRRYTSVIKYKEVKSLFIIDFEIRTGLLVST